MADLGDIGSRFEFYQPGWWSGTQSLSRNVNVSGDKSRRLFLYQTNSGCAIEITRSDASTGDYSFTGLSNSYLYRIEILGKDDTERGDVYNHLTPG